MRNLGRAFVIMVVVNVAALCWMGQSLGDWDPLKLDSFVRTLAEHWYGSGPSFWLAFPLGLIVFETLLFFAALLLTKLGKGLFWSVILPTLAVFGLISLKAWDIQRSVNRFQKRTVNVVEKAVEQTGDAVKKAMEKANDSVAKP